MSASPPVVISAAVEGTVDEAVVGRLIAEAGGTLGVVYGKSGKRHLLERTPAYNAAATHSPWMVLVDLDHDAECAPPALQRWLPTPAPNMCYRIAVREVESWLLADRERLTSFLGVSLSRIPTAPESIDDPKQLMVNLARHSRRRHIREDMVPREGSGRLVGPAYTSRLIEFVTDSASGWRPQVAATNSESLRRCLTCLRSLVARRTR